MQRQWLSNFRATTILVALALAMNACGSTSDGGSAAVKAIKIDVVPKTTNNSYWDEVHAGASCYASQVQNVTVEWNGVSSEANIAGQIALLQSDLSQSPTGLIYAATNAQSLAQVTSQAQSQNVPVYNIDSGTIPQQVPLFATDNTAGAAKAADELGSLLNGHGKIAILEFIPGAVTNDQRVNGFKQELATKYPGIQIVADQADQSDASTALTVTKSILTAHPDLNGIYAANQPGGEGVAQALSVAGLGGKLQVVSFDASQTELTDVQKGLLEALVVQNPFKMGYDSVKAMVGELRNNVMATNEDTGVTVVTQANLTASQTQALLNPSCANPPLS